MSVCETLRYGRCLNSDRKGLQRETNLRVELISLSERSGRKHCKFSVLFAAA